MQFSRGFRAHLRWTLLHPEEVFLQHWVGLYLSPDWIRHTHPPAQGQGHKSECKKDRTQMKGCVSNRRKVRGPEAWASLINMYSSNPSEKRVWKLRTKMPTQAGQNFLPLLPSLIPQGPKRPVYCIRPNLRKDTSFVFRREMFKPIHQEPRFLHSSSTRLKSSH